MPVFALVLKHCICSHCPSHQHLWLEMSAGVTYWSSLRLRLRGHLGSCMCVHFAPNLGEERNCGYVDATYEARVA